LAAIVAQASSPLEHNLLMATQEVVSLYPPVNKAILKGISPAPFYKLFPATISCTNDLSKLTFSATPFNTVANKASQVVSFKSPLLAFVKGVLTAETMTTSLGDFLRRSGLN
jgi:hypothetical protein